MCKPHIRIMSGLPIWFINHLLIESPLCSHLRALAVTSQLLHCLPQKLLISSKMTQAFQNKKFGVPCKHLNWFSCDNYRFGFILMPKPSPEMQIFFSETKLSPPPPHTHPFYQSPILINNRFEGERLLHDFHSHISRP